MGQKISACFFSHLKLIKYSGKPTKVRSNQPPCTESLELKRSITLQTTSDRVLDVSKIEIDKSAACADDTGYVGEYIDSSVFFHNSFNHIAAVICRRNIGFQEGNIALFFISDAFFSVFPCFLERCCYNKEK